MYFWKIICTVHAFDSYYMNQSFHVILWYFIYTRYYHSIRLLIIIFTFKIDNDSSSESNNSDWSSILFCLMLNAVSVPSPLAKNMREKQNHYFSNIQLPQILKGVRNLILFLNEHFATPILLYSTMLHVIVRSKNYRLMYLVASRNFCWSSTAKSLI